MAVPTPASAQLAKVCVTCGKDVSGQKRTRDERGRYFCAPCWAAAALAARAAGVDVPAVTAGVATRTVPPDAPLFCESCNGSFRAGELMLSVDGRVTCKACLGRSGADPAARRSWWIGHATAITGAIALGIGGYYGEWWQKVLQSSGSAALAWAACAVPFGAGVALLAVGRACFARAGVAKPWEAIRRISLILAALWTTVAVWAACVQGVWLASPQLPASAFAKPAEASELNQALLWTVPPAVALWVVSLLKGKVTR